MNSEFLLLLIRLRQHSSYYTLPSPLPTAKPRASPRAVPTPTARLWFSAPWRKHGIPLPTGPTSPSGDFPPRIHRLCLHAIGTLLFYQFRSGWRGNIFGRVAGALIEADGAVKFRAGGGAGEPMAGSRAWGSSPRPAGRVRGKLRHW